MSRARTSAAVAALAILGAVLAPVTARAATAGTITTYAGSPELEAATAISQAPRGVAVWGNEVYVADVANHVVRAVDTTTGQARVAAGNGTAGFSGDGGRATSAELNGPSAIAFDRAGNLYVADTANHRIRKVDAGSGTITTVAGNGDEGGVGAPPAVVVDGGGNVYVATKQRQVLKMDATTGIMTGYVTLTADVTGLAVDPAGTLYVADGSGVHRVDATAGVPTVTTVHKSPLWGVAHFGSSLYVVDNAHRVLTVPEAGGTATTVAGDGAKNFSGDGGLATSATLNNPRGVSVDGSGNLYIADFGNNRVRSVAPGADGRVNAVGDEIIDTVAGDGSPVATAIGDGGPATSALLNSARGVALDAAGNLYIADTDNARVRKVDAETRDITTVAGGVPCPPFAGDGGLATSACLFSPTGVALDSQDNLYIVDSALDRSTVRKVDGNQIITRVAGRYGSADSTFSGDGAAATSARLHRPSAIAFDEQDNLYIADTGNNRVRKVDASSRNITTVAGGGDVPGGLGDGGAATLAALNSPHGVAVDPSGNLYIADTGNHRVRKRDAATGTITTVAGDGTAGFSGDGERATGARLRDPTGVALDGARNLYVADTSNHRLRRVGTDGIIATVAGGGTAFGDGGPATSARLNEPRAAAAAAAAAAAGHLYIADTGHNRVRRVEAGGQPAPPSGSADLVLTITDTPDPAVEGSDVTFTVTVTNAGPDGAQQVKVTDVLPDTLRYRSSSASQGSCTGPAEGSSGGTVTCNLGNLAATATATLTIVAATTKAGTVTNTASVSAATTDPSPANNAGTAATTVVSVAPPGLPDTADVSVTVAAVPETVAVGQEITYTVTATNTGPSTARQVTLTSEVSPGATGTSVDTSQGSCEQGSLVSEAPTGTSVGCRLGDLGPGATATVTVNVIARQRGSVYNITRAIANTPDPDTADNIATATVTVTGVSADLVFQMSADGEGSNGGGFNADPRKVGSDITYQLRVTNLGPDAAQQVEVTDDLRLGLRYKSASTTRGSCLRTSDTGVTCGLGPLGAAEVAVVTVVGTVTDNGQVINDARLSTSTPDPNGANNETRSHESTGTGGNADLSVTAQALPEPVGAGSPLTYSVVASNAGPYKSLRSKLKVELPPTFTFQHASGAPCQYEAATGRPPTVTCELEEIVRDGVRAVDIRVIPTEAGTMSSDFDITDNPLKVDTPPETIESPDPNAANNSATLSTTVNRWAEHWPLFGGDRGRSGYQPVETGSGAVGLSYYRTGSSDDDIVTSAITSSGLRAQQVVAYGTGDGRVHLRKLATGAEVGPQGGVDVSDELNAFGEGKGRVAFVHATSRPVDVGQIFVVHNDAAGVSIAQIHAATGEVVRDVAVTPAAGFDVNSAALLIDPVPGQNHHLLFFVAFDGAGNQKLFRLPIINPSSRDAHIDTSTATATIDANLNPEASPTLVYLDVPPASPTPGGTVDQAEPVAAPFVAVGGTDGRLRTFRADNLAEGSSAQVAGPDHKVMTPSVPRTHAGTTPGAPGNGSRKAPFVYVASTGNAGGSSPTSRVHRLEQTADGAGFVIVSSTALPGAASPALATDQEVVSDVAQVPSSVFLATTSGLSRLRTDDLTVAASRDAAAGDGFGSTVPGVTNGLTFAMTDEGHQRVLDRSTLQPVVPGRFTEDAANVEATRSFGQPAISKSTVAFTTDRGLFVYRLPAADPPPDPDPGTDQGGGTDGGGTDGGGTDGGGTDGGGTDGGGTGTGGSGTGGTGTGGGGTGTGGTGTGGTGTGGTGTGGGGDQALGSLGPLGSARPLGPLGTLGTLSSVVDQENEERSGAGPRDDAGASPANGAAPGVSGSARSGQALPAGVDSRSRQTGTSLSESVNGGRTLNGTSSAGDAPTASSPEARAGEAGTGATSRRVQDRAGATGQGDEVATEKTSLRSQLLGSGLVALLLGLSTVLFRRRWGGKALSLPKLPPPPPPSLATRKF